MSFFVDSNICIAVVTDDTDRSTVARDLLNTDRRFDSSIYNIMEVRNVLATKYHFPPTRIGTIEETIRRYTGAISHSSVLLQEADSIQEETYVTAMDAIMLAAAEQIDGPLVTFDSELHRHGGVAPEDILA